MLDKIKKIVNKKICSDILIIGKGSSLDLINLNRTDNFLKICVNDSEDIVSGDFCVFRHTWVKNKINLRGPKSLLYVTNQKLNTDINNFYVEMNNVLPETSESLKKSLFTSNLSVDKAILLSALRLAYKCIEIGSKAKRIILLGFDFTSQSEVSEKLNDPFHFEDQEYESYLIQTQRKLFIKIIENQKSFTIPIQHVGRQNFSMYSPETFNNIFLRDSNIKSLESSQNHKVKIVAELTTNHFGDDDRLKSMIFEAAAAGANYVKLQKRDVDNFYSKEKLLEKYNSPFGKTFGDYRHGLELTNEQFELVEEICKKLGIKWFASVLDIKSFKFIENFQPEMVKLPSTISQHKDLLNYVSKNYKKDIVISTGYENESYQKEMVQLFKNSRTLYLLQTTSSYPTPGDEAQIGVVRHYYNMSQKNKNLKAGYSSHDIGSIGSMLAIAAGATMIEKHVKIGSVNWAHFDDVAVNLINNDFKGYVLNLRKAELMVGSETKKIQPSEHHKYFVKK